MPPPSCSLWPCWKGDVTSCLSLCLLLASPEGPRGASRGSDGSSAGPCSPAPPGPGRLAASPAPADHQRSNGPRSRCRLPGPCSVVGVGLGLRHVPPPPPCGFPRPRRCHSCQQAGCVTATLPGLTQLGTGQRLRHTHEQTQNTTVHSCTQLGAYRPLTHSNMLAGKQTQANAHTNVYMLTHTHTIPISLFPSHLFLLSLSVPLSLFHSINLSFIRTAAHLQARVH